MDRKIAARLVETIPSLKKGMDDEQSVVIAACEAANLNPEGIQEDEAKLLWGAYRLVK